jgi:hypothetical protein
MLTWLSISMFQRIPKTISTELDERREQDALARPTHLYHSQSSRTAALFSKVFLYKLANCCYCHSVRLISLTVVVYCVRFIICPC